jgi:hypothetical protein
LCRLSLSPVLTLFARCVCLIVGVVIGSTVIAFNSALSVENVTAAAFVEDESAQQAAIEATADSMPGVLAEQVSITNVTDMSGGARRLAGDGDVGEAVLVNGIVIDFFIETTTEQLAQFCVDCGNSTVDAYSYLSGSLAQAVNDGAYSQYLRAASVALNATATLSAVAEANSTQTSPYTAWVTTPSPSTSPTAISVLGAASTLAQSDEAPLIGSLAGVAVFIAVFVVFYVKPAWRKRVGDTIRDSLSGGVELRQSTWLPSKADMVAAEQTVSNNTVRNPLTLCVEHEEQAADNADVESPMHREMQKNHAQALSE